jgi:hypothetical protein
VNVFITNLHKDAAALSEEFPRQEQPVAQVGEVRVDAQLLGVAEGFDLLRL